MEPEVPLRRRVDTVLENPVDRYKLISVAPFSEILAAKRAYSFGVTCDDSRKILQVDVTNETVCLSARGRVEHRLDFEDLVTFDQPDETFSIKLDFKNKSFDLELDTVEENHALSRLLCAILERMDLKKMGIQRREPKSNAAGLDVFSLAPATVYIKEGILLKRGNTTFPVWAKRYVRVKQGEFSYYKHNEEQPLNIVQLWESNCEIKPVDYNGFSIYMNNRKYTFRVQPDKLKGQQERDEWVKAFKRACCSKRTTMILLATKRASLKRRKKHTEETAPGTQPAEATVTVSDSLSKSGNEFTNVSRKKSLRNDSSNDKKLSFKLRLRSSKNKESKMSKTSSADNSIPESFEPETVIEVSENEEYGKVFESLDHNIKRGSYTDVYNNLVDLGNDVLLDDHTCIDREKSYGDADVYNTVPPGIRKVPQNAPEEVIHHVQDESTENCNSLSFSSPEDLNEPLTVPLDAPENKDSSPVEKIRNSSDSMLSITQDDLNEEIQDINVSTTEDDLELALNSFDNLLGSTDETDTFSEWLYSKIGAPKFIRLQSEEEGLIDNVQNINLDTQIRSENELPDKAFSSLESEVPRPVPLPRSKKSAGKAESNHDEIVEQSSEYEEVFNDVSVRPPIPEPDRQSVIEEYLKDSEAYEKSQIPAHDSLDDITPRNKLVREVSSDNSILSFHEVKNKMETVLSEQLKNRASGKHEVPMGLVKHIHDVVLPVPPPLPVGVPIPPPLPLDVADSKRKVSVPSQFRKFHWTSIPDKMVAGSIWDPKMNHPQFPLDKVVIQAQFGVQTQNSVTPSFTTSIETARQKQTILLDAARAQNVAIFLRGFSLRGEDFTDNLSKLREEDSDISMGQLKAMKRFKPRADDKEMYKPFLHENTSSLHAVDQFMIELLQITELDLRVDLLLSLWEFPDRITSLGTAYNHLQDGYEQLFHCQKFVSILLYILELGNYLNTGTTGQRATKGFQMTSLSSMTEMKGNNRPYTLLYCLVHNLKMYHPELLTFADELTYIGKCKDLSINALSAELEILRVDLEKIKKSARTLKKKLKKVSDEEKSFLQSMEVVLNDYEKRITDAQKTNSGVLSLYQQTLIRFGQHKHLESSEFLDPIVQFIDKFNNVSLKVTH